MIKALPEFPDNVVAFVCTGRVSRQDYETVIIPVVEQALKDHAKVRLYYEIGAEFEEVEPAAIWEDFKIGMQHVTRWERIAVVTDVAWIKHSIQMFGFIMPGELSVFSRSDAAKARAWIVAP